MELSLLELDADLEPSTPNNAAWHSQSIFRNLQIESHGNPVDQV
jgi:hypothetical protein